jgi:nonsense-mediated mRNA decay protein 3
MKTSDMLGHGKQYHTKTHLGHLLNVGDTALGFDFANSNLNDDNLDAIKAENLPDVVRIIFLLPNILFKYNNLSFFFYIFV